MNAQIEGRERAQARLIRGRVATWVAIAITLGLTVSGGFVMLNHALNTTFLGGVVVVGSIITIVCAGFRVVAQASDLEGYGKHIIHAIAAQAPLVAAVTGSATVMLVTFKIGG